MRKVGWFLVAALGSAFGCRGDWDDTVADAQDDGRTNDGTGADADAERDEGGGAISWSLDDPPRRDPEKASAYCRTALDMFTAVLPHYRDEAAPVGDLNTLYHMERLFHGMTGVYEVTGNEEIVTHLLDISLQVVAAGVDLNDDGLLDYCFRDPDGTIAGECDFQDGVMPTYPWRAMRGPARTLRAVKTSALAAERSGDFETLRAFLWSHVIDKWLDLDGDGPDTGLRGTDTAGILSRMAGILVDYYYATGDAAAGRLAEEWVVRVSTDMEPSALVDGAYYFDNWVRETPREEPADTSHANEIVVILIEGFEAGFLDYALVAPLHRTLLEIMWDGSPESPLFSEYVDGSGGMFPAQVVMGWMRLGQFKGDTQALSENIDFSTSYDLSVIEANGNLCRNFGLATAEYPVPLP